MSTKIFKIIPAVALAFTFLACSFLTSQFTSRPSTSEIEKEEQAVYSFFVSGSDPVLILQNTSTNISDDDSQQMVDSIKSSFKEVSNETLDSYVERNKEPSQLSPDMDLGVKYVLLSQPEKIGRASCRERV